MVSGRSEPAAAEVTPSEWPASLMLDELWLRSRRALVHRLEATGWWSTGTAVEAHRAHRADLGDDLSRTLLAKVLTPADRQYFLSDVAFGAAADQMTAKVGRCLAFGYELGVALHRVVTGEEGSLVEPCSRAEARVAEACALFNLGVALFDLVHDELPEQANALTQVLNGDVLVDVLTSRQATAELAATAAVLEPRELRLLNCLVAAFIAELHDAVSTPDVLEDVGALISRAYAAEIRSVNDRDAVSSVRNSRAKSVLPFHVLLETVALLGDAPAATSVPALRPAVEAMGTAFWLVDDLMDLVTDFQTGSLNSILAGARQTMPSGDGPADPEYALLRHVLAENGIADAAEGAVIALQTMSDGFLTESPNRGTAAAAAAMVQDHVRFWVE